LNDPESLTRRHLPIRRHAISEPVMKAYLVLDLTIHDFAGFAPYIAAIPGFIEKHGGRYIVQGVEPTIIEGDWRPDRVVVIEFPSRQDAEAFLGDPDAQALFKVRHGTTTSKLVLVEGCF
jgi:uncharacterized protein (DUF1330 family)